MEDNYKQIIQQADSIELDGILKNMDRTKYPERFLLVEKEIANRNDPDYVKPDPIPAPKHRPKNQYDATTERFWASVIDGALCLAITTGLYLMMGMGLPKGSNLDGIIIRVLYTVGTTYWFSKTLGKHLMGIVVIDHLSRGKVSFKQSVMREIGPVASILLMVIALLWVRIAPGPIPLLLLLCAAFGSLAWAILELVTMFSNDERRALHDKIAGTSVVLKSLLK
jgi:uncharacterized RDD family membrane protein YckC